MDLPQQSDIYAISYCVRLSHDIPDFHVLAGDSPIRRHIEVAAQRVVINVDAAHLFKISSLQSERKYQKHISITLSLSPEHKRRTKCASLAS
jgi:hypothetical protein